MNLLSEYKTKTIFVNKFLKYKGNEKIKINSERVFASIPIEFGVVGEYKNINKYEKILTESENGEDGVLDYIFKKIGTFNKYYVEFGAWDGKAGSNSHYFREKLNWNGLLMEGDIKKVLSIDKTERDIINLQHEWITYDNINDLFIKYNVPYKFDLLSIDIDSYDYYVWKFLNYEPNVVIVETHPGLPNDVPLGIIKEKSSIISMGYFGANLLAFYKLAKKKGYMFITTVRWNAIFVKKELFNKLEMEEISENECIDKYFKPNNTNIMLVY
jgi:hypothetical protein